MKKSLPNPVLTTLISLAVLLLVWQCIVWIGDYPPYLFPGPLAVWNAFVFMVQDGRLLRHAAITISEAIPGLMIGCALAIPLGYLLAKSRLAERVLSPYLVASQAIPVIAIAPLLTLWIDSTYWSRVLVAVLVVFFPILVNMIAGMRGVSAELYDLMHSLKATTLQTFRRLEFPAALPVLLAGLRVGATLAVIGTLVGEFVQPRSQGLGFLLVTARYQFKTAEVFVVLITLGVIALTLYGAVLLLERRLLRWQRVV
ncbi:MAG: ABC transporter permease [Anaerolineae bacterium]|nr:ABC transporter permease [Anaerolineae bacterium]MCO5193361.1 ABC transporter permease [Anaerolineae bacterium]MCO5198836.1 ABC transporter permease [Anaerolineae bacterium]